MPTSLRASMHRKQWAPGFSCTPHAANHSNRIRSMLGAEAPPRVLCGCTAPHGLKFMTTHRALDDGCPLAMHSGCRHWRPQQGRHRPPNQDLLLPFRMLQQALAAQPALRPATQSAVRPSACGTGGRRASSSCWLRQGRHYSGKIGVYHSRQRIHSRRRNERHRCPSRNQHEKRCLVKRHPFQ